MEVGLGPGHIVLDGDSVIPSQRGTAPPLIFSPYLLWSNGWLDQESTWLEVGLGPGDIVLDGDPNTQLPQMRHSP